LLGLALPAARAQGGTVVAWGSNTSDKTNVPPSATNVIALSGGIEHSLALRDDGTLIGWGGNTYGQTNAPANLTNLVALSAGGTHNLVLRRDGAVLAWGSNAYGETNVPSTAAGAVAVAAAYGRSLALHADGSVTGWGSYGSTPHPPARATNLARISAGTANSPSGGLCIGLRRDGTVVVWGPSLSSLTNVPASVTNAVAVAAGSGYALALRAGGAVLAWGSGPGTTVPPSATNVVAIAAGNNHGLALRADGTVLAWGDNTSGQATVPSGLANVIAIDAGGTHSLALLGDGGPHFTDSARPVLAYLGRPLTLNALAVGAAPLSYRWQHNGTNLDGAVGPTLDLPDVQFSDAGTYSVVVSNPQGESTGNVASVEVDLPPAPPAITRDPESQTVLGGTNVLFSVEVTGHPAPTFQWQLNGTNLAGAARSNYALPYVTPAHAGNYRVIASNASGSVTSGVAALTVNLPPWPLVTNWPASRVVSLGSPVTLEVAATGTPPLNYQWRLDGRDLAGVTGPSLNFNAVRRADAGAYSVEVSNASGTTTSPEFAVTVTPVAVWGSGPATNLPSSLSNAVAVAAGRQHALALKSDGTVVAWGSSNVVTRTLQGAFVTNHYGQLDVPVGLDRVVAVACGDYHNLALREDATVVAWGWNSGGQTNVPSHATNVIAVAAGSAHSLALQANGTVLAWGTNTSGQLNVPLHATNVIAIGAGNAHSLGLRADGSVVAWGANSSFQCNVPTAATNIVAITASSNYSVALKGPGTDGRMVRWGSYPMQPPSMSPSDQDPSGVEAAGAGPDHLLVLRAGRPVLTLSRGGGPTPGAAPTWLTHPVAVAAGGSFSLAVVNEAEPYPPSQPAVRSGFLDGTAVFNLQGPGTTRDAYQWHFNGTQLAGATGPFLLLTNLQPEEAGDYTVAAANLSGAVTSRVARLEVVTPPAPELLRQPVSLTAPTGANVNFQVATLPGVPAFFQWQFNETNLPGATSASLWLTNVQASHAGGYRAIASNRSGSVISEVASLSLTSAPPALPTILIPPQELTVAPGLTAVFRVTATGDEPLAYQWQREGTNLPGAAQSILTLVNVQPIDVGFYQVAITNVRGGLTSAPVSLALSPIAAWGAGQIGVPDGESNLLAIAAGASHALALRSSGTVVGWGSNSSGQTTVPSAATNVVAIAAGTRHSLALQADGTVLAWGGGFDGQNQVPPGLSNVIAIATSSDHNLAVRDDGTVLAWGDNFFGQCDVPVDLTNAVAVAAGTFGSTALRSDGTVVTWGSPSGEVPPSHLTNVVAIAMGSVPCLALKADGTVVGWGSPTATPPPGLSNLVAVAAGSGSYYAVKEDGTLAAWGAAPELPAGLANVLAVTASGSYAMALVGPPEPRVASFSTDRTLVAGSRLVIGSAGLGDRPLGYEWRRDGQPVAWTTEPFLLLPNAQSADAGTYSLVMANAHGAITGQVAELTVTPSAPVILSHPASQTIALGGAVELSVEAVGSSLTYQWQHAGTNLVDDGRISGAGTTRLRIPAAELPDSGAYVVALSGSLGQETSLPAVLTVLPPTLEEAVDTVGWAWTTGGDSEWHWQSAVTHDGLDAAVSGPLAYSQTSSMETTLTGPVTLGFWWRVSSYVSGGYLRLRLDGRDLAVVSGEVDWQASSVHVPAGAHTLRWEYARTASSYTTGQDRAWLDQVGLVDLVAPTIVTPPTPRTVPAGSSVAFDVVAQGTLPLSYQWQWDGRDLGGETNATLNVTNVQSSGTYSVIVSNVSATNSASASLTVVGGAPTIATQPSARTAALGGHATFACAAQGSAPLGFQWQFAGENIPGATGPTFTLVNVQPDQVGRYRVAANNAFGTTLSAEAPLNLVPVAAWGSPTFPPYSGLSRYDPTQVPVDVGDAVSLAAGTSFSLALRRDGSVAFWGANVQYIPYAYPPTTDGLVSISAAAGYALGIRADGTVVVWGQSAEPVSPPDLANAVAVAAGTDHALALLEDGSVIAWGNNALGQTNVPPGADRIVAIANGGSHSLALREDGTVHGWGGDPSGQTDVPLGLTNAVALAAGLNHSLALRDDGTVIAWGDNQFGQISVPEGLTNVVAIAAGEDHNLALREDGIVVAWGANLYGQAEVPAFLTNIVALAGGGGHSLALVGDGQPVVTVQPFSRQAERHGTTRLRVMAVGAGPLDYQWWREDTLLEGETRATLLLTDLSSASAGRYRCVVSNPHGQTTSHEAVLSVFAPRLEFDPAGTFPAADGFHLRVTGLLGEGETVISSSADLVTWEPIHTNAPVIGVLDWVDRSATNGTQFYRATEARTP
jgi:alpha-tubulin suppressor-like RCC1 family protein